MPSAKVSRRHLVAAVGAAALSPAAGWAQPAGSFNIDAYVLLRIFQAAIEGHMAAMLRSLNVIASAAGEPTWTTAGPALKSVAQLAPTRPTAWLAAPDGSYVTTFDNAAAPNNLRSEAFFADLMAGRTVAGEVMISRVSRQRVIVAAQPVMRSGRAIGAVGVEIPARAVMDVVDSYYQMPPDLFFLVLNDTGLIILHSERARIFQTPDLTEPSMAAALRRILIERTGAVRYSARGQRRLAVFNKSDSLGWRFLLVKTLS